MESEYDRINGDETEMSSAADTLYEGLLKRGVGLSTGVPCGVLKDIIAHFEGGEEMCHIRAQNEPESVGIAAGAYLAGNSPVLYMQNSGFLKSVNEFGSLLVPYGIPVVSIVSYRGCPGEDAPQHFTTGRITKPTLDSLDIPYAELEGSNIEDMLENVDEWMTTDLPSVMLVRRGWQGGKYNIGLSDTDAYAPTGVTLSTTLHSGKEEQYEGDVKHPMQREEAIDAVCDAVDDSTAVIATTGLISRSLFERHDAPNHFYMTGSFGLASSIGLGFAVCRPETPTLVMDGDGSLLTNLGSMVTTGYHSPNNLVHVVLDNNAYGSCSGERTLSDMASFTELARYLGYEQVAKPRDAEELSYSVSEAMEGGGPALIQAPLLAGGRRDFARPRELYAVAQRFREHFS